MDIIQVGLLGITAVFLALFYQKLQKRIQHFNQHCGMYLHLYLSDRKIGDCIVLHQ